MRIVKRVNNGPKIVLDGVPQALAMDPLEPYISPFHKDEVYEFSHDQLPYPKVYEARGLIVSAIRGGVEEFLNDWTAFEVYVQIGCKIATDWVSLLHYDMALEFEPLEIGPLNPFRAKIRMARNVGEVGLELRLSFRGVMYREVM